MCQRVMSALSECGPRSGRAVGSDAAVSIIKNAGDLPFFERERGRTKPKERGQRPYVYPFSRCRNGKACAIDTKAAVRFDHSTLSMRYL